MKRIKFEKSSFSWYRISSLVFALVFIVLGSGFISNYSSVTLFILGFLIVIFELSRIFWYKCYVKYNSKGIYIRINSTLGKNFNFKNITKVKVNSNEMTITSNDANYAIDLNKIDRNDIDDLAEIIVNKSNAEYKNDVMHEKFYSKPK